MEAEDRLDGLGLTEKQAIRFQDWQREHNKEVYKAGIREVVEWVETQMNINILFPQIWQAKLKEWGV